MIKRTLWNTGVQTLAKVITGVVSFWTTRILLQKIPLAEYGVFTLLSSSFLILDSLADFGTRMIGVKELSQKQGDKNVLRELVYLRLILAMVALGLGVVFVFLNQVLVPYRWPAMLALSMLWLTSVAGSLEMLCQVKERLDIKSGAEIWFSLVAIGLLLLVKNVDLTIVYGIYLVARVLSLGWEAFWVGKVWSGFDGIWGKVKIASLKKLLVQAVPMGLYLLLFTSYDRTVDTWLINHWWGKEQVALYGLAYKVYTNLVMPAYFFMSSVFPKLASEQESGRIMVVKKSWPWLMLMALGVVVITWLLSPVVFLILYKNSQIDSVNILRILSLALFFSYTNHLLGFWMVSQNRQKTLLKLGLFGLLLNTTLNYFLISNYSYWAASWVTVATEAVMSLLLFLSLR